MKPCLTQRGDGLRQVNTAVIEGSANDHSRHTKRLQGQERQEIGHATDATGGDHRNSAALRHGSQGLQVGAGEGSISGDVGGDDRRDASGTELLGQIGG